MAERSANKAILVGRLGCDAETRYTQSGTPVSRVSLAMNRQWKDRDDQIHEETDWIQVILWRSERLAGYLTKGKQVYVEGRLQTRSYDDNGGVKRYVTEVIAQHVILLGGANGNGSGSEERSERRRSEAHSAGAPRNTRQEPEMGEMVDDPDVPF